MTTFAQRLREIYDSDADRVAIVLQHAKQADTPITYRELLRGAAGYARLLADANVKRGDVVVVILQHGEALVSAFWGAVLHGAVPAIMPFLTDKLSPEKYRRDLAGLIQVTQPAAFVVYPEFVGEVRAAVGDGSPRVLVAENVAPTEPDFAALEGSRANADDIVLLQHSSGSTGLQKGVALSHRAVFNQLESYAAAIGLARDDVIVSWLPLYHDMGLIAAFIMPVLMRAQLVLMSPFDWVRAPGKLMQAISRYNGTLCWLPNFAYNFCAQKTRDRDLDGVRLDSMRAFVNCSEPMYDASHRMFVSRFAPYGVRETMLATCYAMAENTFAVSQSVVGVSPTVDGARPSAGRLLPNCRARIVRTPDFAELPEGEVGEIAIKSDCMLTSYYRRPDAIAKAMVPFDAEPNWFLTGDLGYLKGGELFVTGRIKDLIIVGGKNVYPQDLEQLVSDVPGVHPGRVVAFGVANEAAGTEDVAILAELEPNSDVDSVSIAIRQTIATNTDVTARYVEVYELGTLIKTSSGKIARTANKERFLSGLAAA